jgi:hypothetical protein
MYCSVANTSNRNIELVSYLNSTDNWHLVIKKLDFSIYENYNQYNGHEYLDLCQGEEPKKELYYYKSSYLTELFTPVFGNFDLFLINNNEIKTLSDFDFNKEKKQENLYFQINLVI